MMRLHDTRDEVQRYAHELCRISGRNVDVHVEGFQDRFWAGCVCRKSHPDDIAIGTNTLLKLGRGGNLHQAIDGARTGHLAKTAREIMQHYLSRHPEISDSAIRKIIPWFYGNGETELG